MVLRVDPKKVLLKGKNQPGSKPVFKIPYIWDKYIFLICCSFFQGAFHKEWFLSQINVCLLVPKYSQQIPINFTLNTGTTLSWAIKEQSSSDASFLGIDSWCNYNWLLSMAIAFHHWKLKALSGTKRYPSLKFNCNVCDMRYQWRSVEKIYGYWNAGSREALSVVAENILMITNTVPSKFVFSLI